MGNCKQYATLVLSVLLLVGALCGCGNQEENKQKENSNQPTEQVDSVSAVDAADQFTDRDHQITVSGNAVAVTLQDNGSVAGGGASVKGNTITVKKAGTYVVSGSLSDGRIVINAGEQDKIHLIFRGVSIICNGQGALYVRQADKVFITLEEGSHNALTSTSDVTDGIDENVDGAIYSKDDLTFNGGGLLTVSGPKHGIVCKADLVVTGGTYAVAAQGGHALQAKKSTRIENGIFALTAVKDGIHVENPDNAEEGYLYVAGGDFTVTADGDGFSAATLVQVSGGSGKLTCGGGADNGETHSDGFGGGFGGWGGGWNNDASAEDDTVSAKGFKGGTALLCTGGTWTLDTADDGLHSNGDVTVSGGTLTVATGDDGIHADGTTTIKDGSVTVTRSYEGIEGNAIEILGGRMNIVASDDGLNAAGGNDESGYGGRSPDQFNSNNSDRYIRISGGHLTVDAGGDGIDANGSLYVEGGETYVSGPTNSGNGPLDYDGQAQVTGGIFVAVGARGMAQGFTSAENQGAALLTTNASANGELVLRDSKGKELLRWTPTKTYSSIAITCPGLTKGAGYTLTAGDEELSFELTDWVYGSSGGFGGGPGGGRPDGGWGGGPGGMGKPGR